MNTSVSSILLALFAVLLFAPARQLLWCTIRNVLSSLWCWKAAFVTSVVYLVPSLAFSYLPDNEETRGVVYAAVIIIMYLVLLAPHLPIPFMSLPSFTRKRRNTIEKNSNIHKRRLKSYPPPYPNGWYMLADSNEIKAGDVKHIEILGQSFAVFRGVIGKVSALNAYCPHMGANIAEGGRVEGDEVLCPFHEWRFNAEGQCVSVPYQESIPSNCHTAAYPTVEWNNMIMIYFDSERRAPPYEPHVLEVMENVRYVCSYNTSFYMHLLEFAENSADTQHFPYIHKEMHIPFTTIPIPCITINHKATFESKDHTVVFTDEASLNFCGKEIPRSGAKATITICGPGGCTSFIFETEFGKVVLFYMLTPTAPLQLDVKFRFYAEPSVPTLLAWYIVGTWASQIESDRLIWEHKVYLKKAAILKNDGPLCKLRRWYNQFYSENSRSVASGHLNW